MDDVYHSRNKLPLVPHTEYYETPGAPPALLGLWCVRRAAGRGGETTLADGYELLKTLDGEERSLMRRSYRWIASEGLRRQGLDISAQHPMLETVNAVPVLRYSHNNMDSQGDSRVADLQGKVLRFFEDTHVSIDIEPNALLLWDNYRMLHSRNGFDDPHRHLRRVLLEVIRDGDTGRSVRSSG
jgi:alpha-ketoglutarate-dependent taurine dioxygenase